MHQIVNMTVLIDNVASEPLVSEWGLSILITVDDRRILLDTGSGNLFTQNAECLGIDLADVDVGVLSHAHYDHADGLDTFFSLNRKALFLVSAAAEENCYGIKDGMMRYNGIHSGILKEHETRIQYINGLHKGADGIWLIPHRKVDYSSIALRNELYRMRDGMLCPDDFAHEQSLVIETGKGLVIFNSCSHTGMVNILADVEEMLNRHDFFAYVGGLHLYKMKDEELYVLCDEIRNTSVEHIFTGHCTGDHAMNILKAELGERIEQFSSGFSFFF